MKAGFYTSDITPAEKVYLGGYGHRTEPCDTVADPLYLRILALEDDQGERLVLVTTDLHLFPLDFSWRIRLWAARELDLPHAAVVLNTSHTHCGPLLAMDYWTNWHKNNAAFVKNLEWEIRAGIRSAISESRPSYIEWGIMEAHFGINRRLPIPGTDRVETTMRPNEDGYYDPDFPIMAVYDADREHLRGLFYSYACHPTSRSFNELSADYPGAIATGLREVFGSSVHTVFAQGAGANVKPRFYDAVERTFCDATASDLVALGQQVARDVDDYLHSGTMRPLDLSLKHEEKVFSIPYDLSRTKSIDEYMAMLDEPDPLECGDPQVSHDFISFMIESLRTDSMAADNDVHMTMINLSEEVRIVAMSCEVAAELGRMVKDLFPKTATIFLGYCYECDYYIPSAKMISEGGYEADRSRSLGLHPGPYVTQIDDLITSAAVELDLRMR